MEVKDFLNKESIIDLSFFNLENTSNNHYPHLGGIIWGLFWKISLLNHEFYGRIIYIFIYV